MNDRLQQHRAALRDAPLARLRRRKATTQELFVALSKHLQRTQVSATASPDEAEGLRPVTTDPAFDETSTPWPGIADPFSPAAESYRHLATNIRLGLLAAGSDVPRPALLLQERHLQPLLQSLRSSWDLILIDTPPALLYDDAFRLASLSDLVLLLAMARQTRRRAVRDVRCHLSDANQGLSFSCKRLMLTSRKIPNSSTSF